MGLQKLRTRFIKRNVNPEWNEELTLSVTAPDQPIKLVRVCVLLMLINERELESVYETMTCVVQKVYDHDTFSKDDKMGDAEFEIGPLLEAVKTNTEGMPNGTVIRRLIPSRQNCLAEESFVTLNNGKIVQDMILRLRNVECGEVEIQLQWVVLPGSSK